MEGVNEIRNQLKLETRQVIFLLLIVIYSTAEFILPKISYQSAKNDNWLIYFLLGIFGLLVSFVAVKLASRFKNETIIQYSKKIVGKKIGFIIGLLYCLFFIQINSVIVGEFAELLAGPFYPSTPLWFFIVTIVIIAGYVVVKGLGVMGRASDVILPLYIVAIVMFPLANITSMDLSNLRPVLTNGIMPVVKGAKTGTIWYGELSLLLMMFPLIKNQKQGYKIALISVLLLTIIMTISGISLVAVFSHELESLTNPYLELARYVKISDSFERPESYLLFIWTSSLVIKIAVFYYCAVVALSQLLNINRMETLILPVGILLVYLSIITTRSSAFLSFLISQILIIPHLIMQLIIPLILLIIAKIRKVGEEA